jgi:hypothetical protein
MRLRIEQAVQLWATGGGLMLLSIVIVTSINVGGFALSRFGIVFGDGASGLPGYEDYVALTVGVAALSFFPYCQLHNGHVVVELFTSNAPDVIARVLDRMWNAVVVVTALFLAYWMCVGLLQKRADDSLSPVLGWPEWPFLLPGIVSLVLWALVAAIQVFEPPREVRRG